MTAAQSYQNYLLTDTWQQLRQRAIVAAGGRCQVCNSSNHIQVHHRQYPQVLGQEPLSFLTVLCEACHALYHHKIPKRHPTKHHKKSRLEKLLKKQDKQRIQLLSLAKQQRQDAFKDKTILRKKYGII